MAQESKRQKSVEEDDRISELPDSLIHHILSFLPSTKQAIQTGILSKRWRKQWAQVPVLIFDSTCTYQETFHNFVKNTLLLHHGLKINTFHLNYDRLRSHYPFTGYEKDTLFDEKIHFATTRHVQDLFLSCAGCNDECFLPQFLFDYASLVKLRTRNCSLNPIGRVNWVFIKALELVRCRLSDQAIECILSGSPLLEMFELIDCVEFKKLVITSKSLKKLVLEDLGVGFIEIACVNLEELSIKNLKVEDPILFELAIEHVLSNSLLLESFLLSDCHSLHQPVIASQSLKRLDLSNIRGFYGFEVSCPKLEDMEISDMVDVMNVKLRNVPSSLCATLLFRIHGRSTLKARKSFTEDILQQLQHVKELTIGAWIVETLTDFKVGDLFPPMLHIKRLILDNFNQRWHLSRMACLLQHLPVLETLIVKLFLYDNFDFLYGDDEPKLDGFRENYQSPNAIGFGCLVSHLKTVKIYGTPQGDAKPARMLNFIRFLLNNARVLESMTIVLKATRYTDYAFKASQELLEFARCSEHAIVELISECS